MLRETPEIQLISQLQECIVIMRKENTREYVLALLNEQETIMKMLNNKTCS